MTRRTVFGQLSAFFGVLGLSGPVPVKSAMMIAIEVDLLRPERRFDLWQAMRDEVRACREEIGIADEGEILCLLSPKEVASASDLKRLQRLWRSVVTE